MKGTYGIAWLLCEDLRVLDHVCGVDVVQLMSEVHHGFRRVLLVTRLCGEEKRLERDHRQRVALLASTCSQARGEELLGGFIDRL